MEREIRWWIDEGEVKQFSLFAPTCGGHVHVLLLQVRAAIIKIKQLSDLNEAVDN